MFILSSEVELLLVMVCDSDYSVDRTSPMSQSDGLSNVKVTEVSCVNVSRG